MSSRQQLLQEAASLAQWPPPPPPPPAQVGGAAPLPLPPATTNLPPPLTTTNLPPLLTTTTLPPPLTTTTLPPPLTTTTLPPPLTTEPPPPLPSKPSPTVWVDIDRLSDHYQIVRRISEGGFGEIFLGYARNDAKKQTPLALKRLFTLRDPARRTQDMTLVDAELTNLERLNERSGLCMRNVVCYVDHFIAFSDQLEPAEQNTDYYIVTKFINGPDMLDFVVTMRDERFPTDALLIRALMTSALRGLGFLHKNGFAHRDIKPDNIIVEGGFNYLDNVRQGKQQSYFDMPESVLIDLGLSCFAPPDNCPVEQSAGTLDYFAPERIEQELLNDRTLTMEQQQRADLWAMGVTFFLLMTHRLPIEKKMFYDEQIPEQDRMEAVVKFMNTFLQQSLKRSFYKADPPAQDVVRTLLSPDPKKRSTAENLYNYLQTTPV